MREALTVSLPANTKGIVERLARAEGLTTSEYVRRAIFRQIWCDAAEESQRSALPAARERGVFTDEDVFRLIS